MRQANILGTSNRTTTISFVSGKGGVGKTSLAVKTAKLLSASGHATLLIDCDYNLSNTMVKMNLPLNDNFYDLISMQKSFDECLIKQGKFHLLPGCNGSINLFERQIEYDKIIFDIINEHQSAYRYIILDCPAGLDPRIINLCAECDDRFFVVTPDKSSITDSYSLMKIMKMRYGINRNHLLINRYLTKMQMEKVSRSLIETAKKFIQTDVICLGGIKELEQKFDQFDQDILDNGHSPLSENILKVIKNYSEEFLGVKRERAAVNVSWPHL